MINFNNTKEANVIADNKVVFCGLTYLVTDKEAEQLKSILDGMVSSRSCNIINKQQTIKTEKQAYVHTHDLKCKYKIQKFDNKNGALYCISRDCGYTKAEKRCINNYIKALKNITEIDVPFTDKNGKQATFKAWGYKTKAQAEKEMKTLPTVITKEELNK